MIVSVAKFLICFDYLTCTRSFTSISSEFTLKMTVLKNSVFDGIRLTIFRTIPQQKKTYLPEPAPNFAVLVQSHANKSIAQTCCPKQCNAIILADSSVYFRQFGVATVKNCFLRHFTYQFLRSCTFVPRGDGCGLPDVFHGIRFSVPIIGGGRCCKRIGRMWLFSNLIGFLIVRFDRRNP